jgi:hypothetical protein
MEAHKEDACNFDFSLARKKQLTNLWAARCCLKSFEFLPSPKTQTKNITPTSSHVQGLLPSLIFLIRSFRINLENSPLPVRSVSISISLLCSVSALALPVRCLLVCVHVCLILMLC